MNRNMKIAFLFAVCAVSVVSFCGEAEAASGVFETLRQKTATFASPIGTIFTWSPTLLPVSSLPTWER